MRKLKISKGWADYTSNPNYTPCTLVVARTSAEVFCDEVVRAQIMDHPDVPACCYTRDGLTAIYFSDDVKLTHSDIAHECNHVLLSMAHYTGWNPGDPACREPAAYLAGWIAKFVYDTFKRHTVTAE